MPLLTPRLSSLWIGLVTPVDAGVAQPLIEGLATETVVGDPSGMALFDVEPTPLAEAMRSGRWPSGSPPRPGSSSADSSANARARSSSIEPVSWNS